MVQKVFGSCAAKTGTQIDESMQARKMDTKEYGKIFLKRILILEEEKVLANSA